MHRKCFRKDVRFMKNGINTVLRIFIIIFCVILSVSLFYIFAVKYLERYYEPAADDAFMSSMEIRGVFPMEDGSVSVAGTYLEDDDILGNSSVFIKNYDGSGKLVNAGGFSCPYGFEFRKASSDGKRVLIELADKNGGAAVYDITRDCRMAGSGVFSGSDSSGGVKAFSCISADGIRVLTVTGGSSLSLKTLSGAELFRSSVSDDIETDGLFYADGRFYFTGTSYDGSARYPHISAFDGSGRECFSVSVLQKEYEFKIDNVFAGADGKTYVTGRRFDGEAFRQAVSSAGAEFTDSELAETAMKAVSRSEAYGGILLASDFIKDPWCSFFISEIDPVSGTVGLINDPMEYSPSKGISNCQTLNESVPAAGEADKGGREVLALLVSKTAPSASSESYAVACHYLYSDLTLSDSAVVHVPSNYHFHPGLLPDGRIFVYLGACGSRGIFTYNFKYYRSTSEMATARNFLSILKSSAAAVKNTVSARFLFYVSLFLLLYVTARYTGAEFARNHEKRKA